MKIIQKIKYQFLLFVTTILFFLPSQAADLSIGVHTGLMGNGFSLGYGISDSLKLRGGFNSFEAGADFDEGELSYSADLEFDNQYLMLDYHPLGWTMRLTFGIYNNSNAFNGRAVATASETFGSGADTITLTQNAIVDTSISYEDSMATYVGIGFGKAAKSSGGLGYSIDIGVVSTGPFQVDIDLADETRQDLINAGNTEAEIDAAVDAEVGDITNNDDFDDIDVWPLIQFGLSYSF